MWGRLSACPTASSRHRWTPLVPIGQVLERSTKTLLKNLNVRLMKDGTAIANTTSDALGVFKFTDVSSTTLNILVTIPNSLSRILATVSV